MTSHRLTKELDTKSFLTFSTFMTGTLTSSSLLSDSSFTFFNFDRESKGPVRDYPIHK